MREGGAEKGTIDVVMVFAAGAVAIFTEGTVHLQTALNPLCLCTSANLYCTRYETVPDPQQTVKGSAAKQSSVFAVRKLVESSFDASS